MLIEINLISNHCMQFFKLFYNLFNLAYHTVIVEYRTHSDIPNYTKLVFNSLQMIHNDSFSANQAGDDRSLKER